MRMRVVGRCARVTVFDCWMFFGMGVVTCQSVYRLLSEASSDESTPELLIV